MASLVDRNEFRKVVKEVVKCLHANLDRPEVTRLTPEQIMFWLQNISLEDLQMVTQEIEADADESVH
jgi:hypothetical protein